MPKDRGHQPVRIFYRNHKADILPEAFPSVGFGKTPLRRNPFQRVPDVRVAQRALGRVENSGKIVRASGNKNLPYPVLRLLG